MSSSSVHKTPADGMECLATMDDITVEDGNYCEYQTYPSMTWHSSLFSTPVVKQLLDTQFGAFMKAVQQPDCKAELRRLLTKGPPIYIEDKHAMPLPDGDTHISSLWFAKNPSEEVSSKLVGALEGEERQKLWDELKLLLVDDDTESSIWRSDEMIKSFEGRWSLSTKSRATRHRSVVSEKEISKHQLRLRNQRRVNIIRTWFRSLS